MRVLGRASRHDSGQLRLVPLQSVLDLLPVTHACDRIEEYRRVMAQGRSFPPISVLPMGKRYIITDGHKRFNALQRLGEPVIWVELWTLGDLGRDQLRQLVHNWQRKKLLLRTLFRDPRQAGQMGMKTLRHWRRVARSMKELLRRGFAQRRKGANARTLTQSKDANHASL